MLGEGDWCRRHLDEVLSEVRGTRWTDVAAGDVKTGNWNETGGLEMSE